MYRRNKVIYANSSQVCWFPESSIISYQKFLLKELLNNLLLHVPDMGNVCIESKVRDDKFA